MGSSMVVKTGEGLAAQISSNETGESVEEQPTLSNLSRKEVGGLRMTTSCISTSVAFGFGIFQTKSRRCSAVGGGCSTSISEDGGRAMVADEEAPGSTTVGGEGESMRK